MTIRIRAATTADAPALATLAERCFRDAFGTDNTPPDMDLHCRTNFSAALQAAEIASPNMRTLLAEEDGALAGYAQLRLREPPACISDRGAIEVQRFYVERSWHGKGVAQQLMRAAIEGVIANGAQTVWLAVWERNPRGIAFYQKEGFRVVGGQVFTLGTDPQRDLVLERPARPPAGQPARQPAK